MGNNINETLWLEMMLGFVCLASIVMGLLREGSVQIEYKKAPCSEISEGYKWHSKNTGQGYNTPLPLYFYSPGISLYCYPYR